jgi:NAD(P)-dependent dehydrogenase (short-subunit alcohol dehydrogenase family)
MSRGEEAGMALRTALVTGASSGIGRECVRHLAARGFKVFAGVRRQEDADALSREGIPSTVPLILEVTDDASIHAAARAVGALLHADDSFALVSNAGMTVGGPLELIDIAAIRQQFEVNVFGPIAMIQAFLPLLRTHRGRIVLMGSLFGRIALPFVAPYAGAKFALEAFADSLSLELRESGIRVILMEPGNIATPIWGRTKQRIRASVITLPEERLAPYRKALDSFERLTDGYAESGIPPLRVARTVARALAARRPRNRYPVGWDARIYGRLGPLLPDRIRLWILYRITLRR